MISHLPTAGALVIIIHAWSTRLVSARASRVIMHGRLNSPPACDSPGIELAENGQPYVINMKRNDCRATASRSRPDLSKHC